MNCIEATDPLKEIELGIGRRGGSVFSSVLRRAPCVNGV